MKNQRVSELASHELAELRRSNATLLELARRIARLAAKRQRKIGRLLGEAREVENALEAMAADAVSESRWAKFYQGENEKVKQRVAELERQNAALQQTNCELNGRWRQDRERLARLEGMAADGADERASAGYQEWMEAEGERVTG